MNPLFQQLMGGMAQQAPQMQSNMMSAFLKQKFPDIPDQIMNDPNQILNYLQQTRGISNQDIQNVQSQMVQGGYNVQTNR